MDGSKPADFSSGKLEAEKDFFCISYESTIIEWLEACQKEAVSKPILRENIRQYILLIKKLTHQLSDQSMENEIYTLIAKNYEAAKTVEKNVEDAEVHYADKLLENIADELSGLESDWDIVIDDVGDKFGGIAVYPKGIKLYCISVQSDTKLYKDNGYISLWAKNEVAHNLIKRVIAENKSAGPIENLKHGGGFLYYRMLNNLEFYQAEVRKKLFSDGTRKLLAKEVANEIEEMAKVLATYTRLNL